MATTGRSVEPSAAATELAEASFVRVLSRADGDALAASGVLARAFAACGIPFQVSVVAGVGERTACLRRSVGSVTGADAGPDVNADVGAGADADTVAVVIGAADISSVAVDAPAEATTAEATTPTPGICQLNPSDRPVTLEAVALARELGVTPDPVLALAGALTAGVDPGAGETEPILESALEEGTLTRRPGVSIPTNDLVDGLAHSTRLRAPWSGDREATADALGSLADGDPTDEAVGRQVASLVALDTVGAEAASKQAGTAVGRVMHPYATFEAPFETLGGVADVLEATARTAPGTGVALAMGHDVSAAALEAWREHGARAHSALESASTGRYDGLFVVGVGGSGDSGTDPDVDTAGDTDTATVNVGTLETVAWLTAHYRAPEPVTLALGDDGAALVAIDDRSFGPALEAIARSLGGEGHGAFDADADVDVNADTDPNATADSNPTSGPDYDIGHRRGTLKFAAPIDQKTVLTAVREAL